MGYPKRITLGRCDCRPKIFKTDKFPPPSLLCSSLCIYSIFCMPELNKTSLGDRIKNLRLSFQKPYYFFSLMENGNRMLIFEDEVGKEITFREKTIVGCVTKAEDYLKAMEIRSGQEARMKEQQGQKGMPIETHPIPPTPPKATPPPSTSPAEENLVDIKTSVVDDKGNKHPDF